MGGDDTQRIRERVKKLYLGVWSDDRKESMWNGDEMIDFGVVVAESERDAATEQEREACAKIAEECNGQVWGSNIAAAIRARVAQEKKA